MSNENAGVWVDHRKAVVVVVKPSTVHTVVITSRVEKHPERSGDSPLKGPYEALQVPADDRRQRALTGALNAYYDTVVAALGGAESLIMFGPGEAKLELRKRLVKKGLGSRIASVETVDKLTDRQVAARVRAYFTGPWLAQGPKSGRPNAGLERPGGRSGSTGDARRASKGRQSKGKAATSAAR
jgi:hypothetical protein